MSLIEVTRFELAASTSRRWAFFYGESEEEHPSAGAMMRLLANAKHERYSLTCVAAKQRRRVQIPPSPLYENRRDYPFVQRSHKDSLSCFHKGLRPLRHTSCAPARNEPACVQCFASSAYRLSPDECSKRMSSVRKRPRTFFFAFTRLVTRLNSSFSAMST